MNESDLASHQVQSDNRYVVQSAEFKSGPTMLIHCKPTLHQQSDLLIRTLIPPISRVSSLALTVFVFAESRMHPNWGLGVGRLADGYMLHV